jgi:decaprenylphospho-beta-D-erythro-pentofuranosid-2-ulose 2-reductase
MLADRSFRHVVLYGANSDIGNSILGQLPLKADSRLTLIGRSAESNRPPVQGFQASEYFQHDLRDLTSYDSLQKFFHSLNDIDLIIFASGILPDENEDLTYDSVINTVSVNTLGACAVLSIATDYLLNEGGGHLLFLSTVAAKRPRLKNFTYGASKAGADFFARGLGHKHRRNAVFVTVIRPGYVYTKMSSRFAPAPFSTSAEKVAVIAARAMLKRKKVVYAPRKLWLIMNLLALIPRRIFNQLH